MEVTTQLIHWFSTIGFSKVDLKVFSVLNQASVGSSIMTFMTTVMVWSYLILQIISLTTRFMRTKDVVSLCLDQVSHRLNKTKSSVTNRQVSPLEITVKFCSKKINYTRIFTNFLWKFAHKKIKKNSCKKMK